MDPLDFIRDYYRAVNRSDLRAVVEAYHIDCAAEGIVPNAPEVIVQGRDQIVRHFESFFEGYEGAADGGHFRVRSLAAIETGWVHVEWQQLDRDRSTGELAQYVGYSHFLVEDGLIRRQRSVAHAVADEPVPSSESRSSTPRSYPPRPVVGVGAVIVQDGKVVLVKRRFEPLAGQWSLPGGTLELGETLEAGVAREILEETGLVVEVGRVIEVFDRILLDEEKRVRYHFVLIDYLCRPIGGELGYASDVADVALVHPTKLEPYRLTPKATAIIAKALAMTRP